MPAFFSAAQWPGNSPDLNICENALSWLKSGVAERDPKTRSELCTAIDEVWAEVTTKERVAPLFASMPKRMREVIKKKGGMTRWCVL